MELGFTRNVAGSKVKAVLASPWTRSTKTVLGPLQTLPKMPAGWPPPPLRGAVAVASCTAWSPLGRLSGWGCEYRRRAWNADTGRELLFLLPFSALDLLGGWV